MHYLFYISLSVYIFCTQTITCAASPVVAGSSSHRQPNIHFITGVTKFFDAIEHDEKAPFDPYYSRTLGYVRSFATHRHFPMHLKFRDPAFKYFPTPLLVAITIHRYLIAVHIAQEFPSYIDAPDEHGNTALHYLAQDQQLPSDEVLRIFKHQLFIPNKSGTTPWLLGNIELNTRLYPQTLAHPHACALREQVGRHAKRELLARVKFQQSTKRSEHPLDSCATSPKRARTT